MLFPYYISKIDIIHILQMNNEIEKKRYLIIFITIIYTTDAISVLYFENGYNTYIINE